MKFWRFELDFWLAEGAVALLLGGTLPASAQYLPGMANVGGAQHGLAVASSTALTVPLTATYATICARGGPINYTTDGVTVPTLALGTPNGASRCVGLPGSLLAGFRAIGPTGTTLDVEYFR